MKVISDAAQLRFNKDSVNLYINFIVPTLRGLLLSQNNIYRFIFFF